MEMIKVRAYFIESVVLEGWSRNATDLFTAKKTMLKPIVYHYFNFVFAGIKYEFKVMDDEQKLQFDTNTTVDILFDAKTKKECSFLNKKRIVHLCEAEDAYTGNVENEDRKPFFTIKYLNLKKHKK